MSTLVGKKAPKFSATAVIDGKSIVRNYGLDQFIGKKYVVLFFYTKDFSGICPSELHDFQDRIDQFKSKNVEVIGCSADSEESHLAWLNLDKDKGGIKGITYTLISDMSKTLDDMMNEMAYVRKLNRVYREELAKPTYTSMAAIASQEGFVMPNGKENIRTHNLGNYKPTLLKFKKKEVANG